MYAFRASSFKAARRWCHLYLATDNINDMRNRRDGPYVILRTHVPHKSFVTRIGVVEPAGGFRGAADSSWARASHASRSSLLIVERCTDSYLSHRAWFTSSRLRERLSQRFAARTWVELPGLLLRGHDVEAVAELISLVF